MKLSHITLLLFFLLNLTALFAQKKETSISGDFRNVNIENFVQEVEKQTGFHFFYDPKIFDLLVLNLEVKDKPLEDVLKEVFNGTDYSYAIDGKRVFLLKGQTIRTTLPAALIGEAGKDTPEIVNGNDRPRSSFQNKLIEVGIKTNDIKPGIVSISGVVKDSKSGYPLAGITIQSDRPGDTATTDASGQFKLNLPTGRHLMSVNAIGKKSLQQQVVVYSDGKLALELEDLIPVLQEVVVSADKIANVNRVQMGVERLTIKNIKQMPTVFGEADVLRAVLTLPGVKTVGEASTGFNVRGGSSDQNLILFNDATIYNPSHFFGFFSAFNPEIVRDVELFKSSIPANYGGRLASVLNVSAREGNKEKFTGSAGIGLLTSRVNIEGPITKGKSSFNVGGRTTYSNWMLKLLPDKYDYKNSKASFHDVNLFTSHTLNENNTLYLTGYLSNDQFNLNSDTTYGYTNRNFSLKWRHVFNKRLLAFFTAGSDHYDYVNESDHNPVNAYKMNFSIDQASVKGDFTYNPNPKHKVDFGFGSIYYKLKPGSFQPNGKESMVSPLQTQTEQALESAVYLTDRFDINRKLSFIPGIRYSIFNYLGPQTVDEYAQNLPKTDANKVNTVAYKSGAVIKTYHGPEIRLSARYSLSPSFSVKAGYNTLRQYLHMMSNTAAISPTDIWKLSDNNIEPQLGNQVSLGLYKNFRNDTIELSFEMYKKTIRNYLDYKSGAVLVLNDHIETDVFKTRGNAYGAEVMIKKRAGKLNGWMSYTYSRILLKMDDPAAGENINNGEYYPANYDKPHDFTLIGNYRINMRFSLSMNFTYSTGRPITVPIGRFYYAGSERTLYADRNSFRIPDYMRTDFSMNIDGNHKVHQRTHNSWTIGVYNLTGRKNPYSVYYTSENGVVNGYKLSIFGSAIPFINFNIKF